MGFLVQFIKLLTKKSGRKIVKFVVYTILGLTALIIFWWIWSYFSVGYLIEEGEFDDVKPQTEYQGQSNGGTDFDNDYDNLAMKISKIDFDALPDDLLAIDALGGAKQYLVPDGYTAEQYLKTYLLFAEICGNPNMDLEGETRVEPYMLYGIWWHENMMSIPNGQDPFKAWLTSYATSGGKAFASFGQSIIPFAEDLPEAPTSGWGLILDFPVTDTVGIDGAGVPVVYVSSVENGSLPEEERLSINVTNDDTSSFVSKLGKSDEYQKHYVGWTGSGAQRPSAFFLPDVAASVAYNMELSFDGRDIYTGNKSSVYWLAYPKQFEAGTDKREYIEFSAVFCARAGKQIYLLSEDNHIVGDILEHLIDTNQLDYFYSQLFIENHGGSANNAYRVDMVPFFEELYGDNGAQSKLPQDLVDELNRQVSEAGGYPAENKKAAVDGVFAISAGKTIVHSIDALADAILANDKYIKEDDFDDSVGSLPSDAYPDGLAQCVMDADYDGICDRCNGSVFEDPKDGCTHKKTSKVVLPIANAKWSDLYDYHEEPGACGQPWHAGASHAAYDMYGDYSLRAVVNGYLMPVTINTGGYGYHTYLAYPNKDTPQLYFSYAHMQTGSCTKPSGGNILAGETVGLMGATGNVTGEHLHFQVSTTPDDQPAQSINYLVKNSTFWLGNKTSNGTVDYTPYVIVGAID